MVTLGTEVHEIGMPELEEIKVFLALTVASKIGIILSVDVDKKF